MLWVANALRGLGEDERALISNKGSDANAANDAWLYVFALLIKSQK